MKTEELTIEDLAKQSGLSLRTLRYYIQEGLLPGPDSLGKYARYSQEHLDRLEIIRRLKNLRLPLSEIRHLLDNMSPSELDKILRYQNALNFNLNAPNIHFEQQSIGISDSSSAIDYIRNLEMTQGNLRALAGSPGGYPPPKTKVSPPLPPHAAQDRKAEAWTRITLADGIELSIRASEASGKQRQIADLVRYAGKLFSSEPKKGGQS
jgi:DNA-binding transcriptional MerR regulator